MANLATTKVITANWGDPDVVPIDGYLARGGYEGLRAATWGIWGAKATKSPGSPPARRAGLGPDRMAPSWIAIAAAGILADWVLKAALAPAWGSWLRSLLPAAPA